MLHKIKNYRADRARRKLIEPNKTKSSFRKWRYLAIGAAILVMAVIIFMICFAHRTPLTHPILSGQAASMHIASPFEFTYESEILTSKERDNVADSIPPVYNVNMDVYTAAETRINSFVSYLNENQKAYDTAVESGADESSFFDRISSGARRVSSLKVIPEDIRIIYKNTSITNREKVFGNALYFMKDIMKDGVYRDGDSLFTKSAEGSVINIEGSGEKLDTSRARERLLSEIKTLGIGEELSYAIYRTMYQELMPNIVFNEARTKERREEARKQVSPVIVKVRENETIIDASTPHTPIVQEKIKALNMESIKRGEAQAANLSKYIEFISCILLVLSATLFIVISRSQRNKQPRTVVIFCFLLLMSLVFERIIIHLSNTQVWDADITLLQIFAFGTPIMLGPIIMVLLFGSYTGFVMAILIAALATMMVGESIVFFILLLASAMVAIYFCSNANSRYRVIMGGVIYGLFIAFFSFTIGLLTDKPLDILWRQSLLAIVAGALTGIFALVLLPIVERIFKTYSNIALLDYTDFNNPLLRRLQIEAPGTYHHSVMVSYLAEAAAATVGANPMICRIGALFHDIGKITKPEFFSENQKNGRNLHDEQNPSMSALIIRNHVREGIELAKAAKLPQQAIDSIHQHHGTTIIAYFYNKAMKLAEGAEQSVDPAQALRDAGIEESTFRHDGRKPQTVENAILMLADSCEAASRSLKKITKHGIEDLVNVIVRSKMNDGQFDECPITVKQLSKIKQSFVFTMLNMMHTRVQYNDDKKQ